MSVWLGLSYLNMPVILSLVYCSKTMCLTHLFVSCGFGALSMSQALDEDLQSHFGGVNAPRFYAQEAHSKITMVISDSKNNCGAV